MGEMIKMVVVLTVLSIVSGGGLSWLKDFTEPKIENQVMNLVKGPAIRNMLSDAENDPVEDRFKIMDGEVERNVFVGVFGGNADTVVMEASASGYGDKVGLVVAINTLLNEIKRLQVLPQFTSLRLPPRAELTVLIQGFGAVGTHVAWLLTAEEPAYAPRVVGISDESGYLYDEAGLPISDLLKIQQEQESPVETQPLRGRGSGQDYFQHLRQVEGR